MHFMQLQVSLKTMQTMHICSPNLFRACSFHQRSEIIFVCSIKVRRAVMKISLAQAKQ